MFARFVGYLKYRYFFIRTKFKALYDRLRG